MGVVRRITLRGKEFSYTDFGGDGPVVLALHGTFGRGAIFDRLAADLAGTARVIAPDQRCHGDSEHGGPFEQEELVADAAALIRALGIGSCVVLGHSHGGVTAYTLATRHPELVDLVIVADSCADVPARHLDVTGWPTHAPTRQALRAAIEGQGIRNAGYFLHSAVVDAAGWRLCFDYADMVAVQRGGQGDRWADWLSSDCPALLVHAANSMLLPAEHATAMATRRPHTSLVTIDAGHWIHDDRPAEFADAVRTFLAAHRSPTVPANG